jgi:hypothetical protein
MVGHIPHTGKAKDEKSFGLEPSKEETTWKT